MIRASSKAPGYVTSSTRGALATHPRGERVAKRDIDACIAEARRFVGAAHEALECGMFAEARHLAGLARAALRLIGLMYPKHHDEAIRLAREAGEIINCCLIEEEWATGR